MTNAELIKALHWCGSDDEQHEMCVDESYSCPMWNEDRMTDYCKAYLMLASADALEAADKRITNLQKQVNEFIKNETHSSVIKAMSRRIAELEAQLPKEGEWIIDGMNEYQLSYGCVGYEPIYRCSKCGITTESYLRTERPIMPEDADFPNYCPNCGAKMDGKERADG